MARPSSEAFSLSLYHDVVILYPDWEGLGDKGAFHEFGAWRHRDLILADADAGRIAPGLSGPDVEFPAVPRALHHLAAAGIAIFARHVRLHQTGLDTLEEAAAAMRAAVVECVELAGKIEHHDGAPTHLNKLAGARRNLIDGSDDVFGH